MSTTGWRLVPLIGALLFLALIGTRAGIHARRYGGSGIMLFRGGRRRQHVRDGLFVLLLVLMTGQALAEAVGPARPSVFGTALAPGAAAALRPIGAAVLFAGLALMLVAQLNLGAAWRIGIEEAARPGLVTSGLFRFCRNPIFLFMLVVLTGFTLLLPTWLSVATLVGAFVGIRQQAIAEEAYLARAYGEDYRRYARRVGRFLPWVGRLR